MFKLFAALFGRTESVLLAAILVTAIVFSLLSPYFFTLSNLVNLVEAYSVTTIFAAGAFVVLVSGGIDVSFTATAAASQYLAAYLIAQVGFPAAPALALAAILGAALGCINALLTYYLRIVSIIVTIATSSIYYALLIYFTNAEEIYNLPDWWSGRITFLRFATASGVVKITLPIVVMIAVVLLTQYLMAWTRIGRQVYALGGNPEAASRVGVGVLRVQLLAYGYLGFLAAVAGFVQAGRVHQAVPTAMAGQELNVLAVAILGGASLVGGVGSVGGVVLAVLFLAMLQTGLNLVGVSSYFFGVVIGLAILISVSLTAYAEYRGRKPFVVRPA
ncbi:MAG: ABC transporter permease [Methylocella sp.]